MSSLRILRLYGQTPRSHHFAVIQWVWRGGFWRKTAVACGGLLFALVATGIMLWWFGPWYVCSGKGVSCMAWRPLHSGELAVGYSDGTVEMLTCSRSRVLSSRRFDFAEKGKLPRAWESICNLEWSPDGEKLLVRGYMPGRPSSPPGDGAEIAVWSMKETRWLEGTNPDKWDRADWRRRCCAWSPDSRRLAIGIIGKRWEFGARYPNGVSTWREGSELPYPSHTMEPNDEWRIHSMSWNANGKTLAFDRGRNRTMLLTMDGQGEKSVEAQELRGTGIASEHLTWCPNPGTSLLAGLNQIAESNDPVGPDAPPRNMTELDGVDPAQQKDPWEIVISAVDPPKACSRLLHRIAIRNPWTRDSSNEPDLRWSPDGKTLYAAYVPDNSLVLDSMSGWAEIRQLWIDATTGNIKARRSIPYLIRLQLPFIYKDCIDGSKGTVGSVAPNLDRIAFSINYNVNKYLTSRLLDKSLPDFSIVRIVPCPSATSEQDIAPNSAP